MLCVQLRGNRTGLLRFFTLYSVAMEKDCTFTVVYTVFSGERTGLVFYNALVISVFSRDGTGLVFYSAFSVQ